MKLLLTILLIFSFILPGYSQSVIASHGISISAAFPKKLRVLVSYDLHLRSHINIHKEVAATPIVDIKVSLFRKHLGSSVLKIYSAPLYANIALSYGTLLSYKYRVNETKGIIPVYTSIYHNSFNNSLLYNIGFASTHMCQLAITSNKNLEKKILDQKIGNFMLGIGDFYLNYYNDGGPVLEHFGDREDRYWTGGVTIGFLLREEKNIHQVEVSFDKFTGFTKHAFEATGLLNINNVIYKDIEQFSYNSGRLALKYLNHGTGLGVSGNIWNLPFDLQDWLHRDVSNNPYHHKVEQPYFDVEAYKVFNF